MATGKAPPVGRLAAADNDAVVVVVVVACADEELIPGKNWVRTSKR